MSFLIRKWTPQTRVHSNDPKQAAEIFTHTSLIEAERLEVTDESTGKIEFFEAYKDYGELKVRQSR